MSGAARNSAWLLKLREEKGIQSKTLDKMPKLFPDIVWVWNAFQFLCTRRTYGFASPNPIGVAELDAYCRLKGIKREDDIEFLVRMVPQMDDIWMEDWNTRAESDRAKKKTKTPPRR